MSPRLFLAISKPFASRQIVSLSTRSSFSAFRCHGMARHAFSSAARQELADMLSREASEEVDTGNTGLPPDLEELRIQLEGASWKIVDDGASTKMIKTLKDGAGKAQIYFHCQDTVDIIDGEEFSDEPAAPVRFTVACSRAGNALVLGCVSENAVAKIQSATMASDDEVEGILTDGGVSAASYQGPVFDELAEDLQDAFHAYLEETVGVNQDVAAFVAMQSDYQEQQSYVSFLEDAQRLVS